MNPFTFPNNCKTEASRLAYCLRYQMVMDDRAIAGTITEQERAANVAEMLPFLRVAQTDASKGIYQNGNPPWVANPGDWNGADMALPPGLNLSNKGAVMSHAKRVMGLREIRLPRDIALVNNVALARQACLEDTYWDGEI